jgi:hypothetical protein
VRFPPATDQVVGAVHRDGPNPRRSVELLVRIWSVMVNSEWTWHDAVALASFRGLSRWHQKDPPTGAVPFFRQQSLSHDVLVSRPSEVSIYLAHGHAVREVAQGCRTFVGCWWTT